MILQIKRGNRVIAESADFSYSPSLQEVRKLTCEVVSVVPIEFKAYNSKSESEYDTVVYNGNTFILYQAPSGDNLNEAGKYKYSLLFYGKEVLLQNVAFLDIVSGTGGEINKIRYTHGGLFQFWGDAKQLAARIEANIESYNASLGVGYTGIGTWTLNVDAEGELTEDMIDITDGTNLFEALKNFYDKFYLNYYFSTTANGGIITITDKTRPSVNWTFKQGDGGGAVKVSSSVDTSTPVITRIIPQGGSRNVPPEYKKDAKPADESRYCPYILLPNDSAGNIRYYIDSEYGLKNYGVRGKTISNTFSGIYPSIRGKKLGDLYPSGLPEWDTYKADGEPDPQSGKVAGEGASASTRIDKIIGSTPIKSDDSDSFFIYMTSPGFNLGYKVYEDGDSSDKINDNVQPQYKPHAMFDKYRDFESFDIYGTRAYYDQPVKVTATFSGKMLFSILPIGSDAVGKKVKINLRMVLNRVLGQASPLKEVVIGEEGATGMLEIPYDKTALVGYIEKGQNTTVTIRVEFTFDSDVPAGSCKIGFSEEMTCNIHFGNQDGSQDRLYYKYASVTDAVFSMRTGTYTGTEFKINKNGIIPLYGEVNGDTGETEEDVAMFNKGARYKISCYRTDSDNAKLPLYTDGKSPSIAAGTEFVILNIVMPESYVTMAENTLEKAALDYLSRYDHENRTVSLDISSGFVAEHPNLFIDFIEGNMLKVRDDGIGVFDFSDNGQIVDMQLQIQSLEIKYSKENMFPSYSCTIARRKILSFYERLAQENQTASTQNTTNVTLGGSGTGSGTNIFSEQLLNDLIASFQKFNGWFEWDEVNQALRCKSAFYTNQWISALGAQSGSGEPGGGEGGLIKAVYGFADLGKTFDDSNLSNTFNAYTINEIWKMAKEGGGIKNITQSGSGNAVTNMALSSDGKTITAVFGETFARQQDLGTLNNTVTQLSNKLNNFLEGSDADNIINKWKELEAFLDGLTESDNLAELLALKADKTITISAGTGLTGGGNLSANRTLSLATTGVNAGTYTKVTVDTYGRVTVGDNPTTLAGYGITDAVTLTTAQTISGQKTFTKNILMDSGIGLSYGGNTVFRNTTGNTVISSYGNEGMIYFRPNGNTSDVGVIQINKQGYLNGVSAGFTGGVSAARLTANEYIQIGDAQLVYDSANKALRVKHRTDGDTVGFYSDGWVSALGVKTGGSGGGSGVVNTVYSFANLTDGTTFSDSDLDNTFNAYTIKKLYDMAGQGGLDADAMWAELKKADSSKVIDASHIPTSVLDGRWVKKAGDTMTGTLTSASTSGAIVFKGVENCDITNIYKDNGVIKNDDGGFTSIRNGLRFNWYDTYWYIGNLRGSSTDSAGFGVVDHNNKLVLRVTPNDVRAPRFMSTVATGLSPLIVSSNTTVDNLSADLLDGYHAFGTSNALIKYGYTVGGTEPAWCRIATYSIRNTETMTDVCFVLHSSFSDLFGLLVVKTRGTAVVEGLLIASYNINRSNIRIYHDAEKKNIELYCYSGSNYSVIQANLLYSHDRNGGANTNITLYRGDTKAPSWSTYVNPVFAPLQNSSEVAKKLQTPRTLWGQSFDGTANVSGDMTGVGSITMSGDLKIGNATSPNTIYFYGTTGDGPGGYNHTFIAERLWGGTESGELVLFKGNDIGNGTDAITASNLGPDRIRHIAAAHLFQTYTTALSGSVESVCTSSALKNLFSIASNRVISYVQLQSTIASGVAPFIVASNTVVGNLNADLLDGYHQTAFSMGWTSSTKYRVDRWGGGQDKNWKKIVTYVNTGGGQYQSCKVKGTIYYITGNHNQGHVIDIPFEAIMYAYGGTANSMLNQSTLYLPPYCSLDLIRIVRYANNSWEVQVRQPSDWTNISLEYTVTNNGGSVSAGQFANTSYSSTVANNYNTNVSRPTSSRVTYADRLTTGRTINGTTFDGTANITTSYWGTTRTFYTNSHDSYRASSGVNVNGSGNVTLLLPNSIRCSDWFRSTGNTGWYHENYGGGWYMTDSSYIRNYNSKILRIQTDNYETIRLVRTSSSGGCSIAFYNGGGTFRGQFGMNSTSWFAFDTGTATANQNVVEISPAGGIHSKAEITAKASGSDIRLKKDIQNYNAMDIINKFRSVKYHWNDVAKANSEVYNNDYDQFGLIAQDLIAGGFKQWVRDVFHDYYTVTYERLIPVVWKGLQEVDDEVTRLKKRVRELENRLGIYNQ